MTEEQYKEAVLDMMQKQIMLLALIDSLIEDYSELIANKEVNKLEVALRIRTRAQQRIQSQM